MMTFHTTAAHGYNNRSTGRLASSGITNGDSCLRAQQARGEKLSHQNFVL